MTDKSLEYIGKMVSPQDRRSSIWRGGVLQIWVTRACTEKCCGCTQLANAAGKPGMITLDQYEQAVKSVRTYWGVVGMFGALPTLHPKFPELCEILCKYIPFEQRGLWANNLNGHGPLCRKVFNPHVSNLNVHLDREAYKEMRRDWPEARPMGLKDDSRHSPPFVAMIDLDALPFPDGSVRPNTEENRLALAVTCDVNRLWSAIICPVRGQLRGYFCELAGSAAMMHENDPDWPDLGVPIEDEWWKRPMTDPAFAAQARFHCQRCGIPLRGYGELAIGGNKEQVSATHANWFKPKRKDRHVELVQLHTQLGKPLEKATSYIENSKLKPQ